MKNLNTYITEKYKISKNIKINSIEDKDWIVYLPNHNKDQYPEEYLIFSNSSRCVYVFSNEELKNLYYSKPNYYRDYYIHKINKKKYQNLLFKIENKTISQEESLSLYIKDSGCNISNIIDSKYIKW